MPELPFDVHDLTVGEAEAEIRELGDADALRLLHEHEESNPRFDGGRKGVLDALEERLGELEAESPAEDAASGPGAADQEGVGADAEDESLVGSMVLAQHGGQEHLARVVGRVTALEVEIQDSLRTHVMVAEGDVRPTA